MANACEHSIADRENTRAGDDLVLSQVVPRARGVAERASVDRVIECGVIAWGEGRSRELHPLAIRLADSRRLTSFCNVFGRQSCNRGSTGNGALLE